MTAVMVEVPLDAINDVASVLQAASVSALAQSNRYAVEAREETVADIAAGLREDAEYARRTSDRLGDAAEGARSARQAHTEAVLAACPLGF